MQKILLGLVIILFSVGCKSSQTTQSLSKYDNNTKDKIKAIENNVYPIETDGTNAKTSQSLIERMSALQVPGLSIAVFENNKIMWTKQYGYQDKNTHQNVDSHTLFQAASISKPIASVATFQLVEQGHLYLDEDVNKKLKRWHVPENEFTSKEKVTPARIMSHTAGLTTSGFQGYNRNALLPSLVEILEGSSKSNSEPVRVFQEPGQSEFYSGGGTTVLQMLLEDITNKPFAELLDEGILNPLGMGQSTFEYPLPKTFAKQTSKGYDKTGNEIAGGYHLYPEKAAAGLWTTSVDLAKFMIALGRSYRDEENGIISQDSANKMMTRIPGAGGMGIGIDGQGEAFRFRHSGGNAGFSCYAASFAEKGRGIVLMTNSDNGYALNHEIARTIVRAYGWQSLWPRE